MMIQETTANAGVPVFMIVAIVAVVLLMVTANWIVYEKAGEPGWASLIPIYNGFVFARMAGKEMWWGFLLLIPLVNFFVWIILCIEVAELFGHGAGFGIGMALLPWIFFPVLAFSDDRPVSDKGQTYPSR